ncbi:MAG: hypothetical protein DMD82_10910 [Candidatus Rokuibacteriota bacterium]|nr:MAG: hypothetical protein DMD82_10910 [Candidatus Rokubacteria bacterium]
MYRRPRACIDRERNQAGGQLAKLLHGGLPFRLELLDQRLERLFRMAAHEAPQRVAQNGTVMGRAQRLLDLAQRGR